MSGKVFVAGFYIHHKGGITMSYKITHLPHESSSTTPTMFKVLLASLLVNLLTACGSAPTRSDTREFKSLQKGQISTSSVQAFTDCLMDGFNSAHGMLSNIVPRQQRRTDSYRVEAMAKSIILVSADIFDNGSVELLESSAAGLIDTSGERKTFASCLDRFRTTN